MPRTSRPPFNKSSEFFARKSFKFNGVTYAPGKPFPWRDIACSVRKLQTMYDANRLVMADDKEQREERVRDRKTRKAPAKKAAAKKPGLRKPVDVTAKPAEKPAETSEDKDEDVEKFLASQE